MTAKCPQCSTLLVVQEQHEAREVACPKCGATLEVPAMEDSAWISENDSAKLLGAQKSPPTKNFPSASGKRSCPFCAETILAAAVKCKHCGSSVSPGEDKRVGRLSAVGVVGVFVGIFFLSCPIIGCAVGTDLTDAIIPLYIIGMIFIGVSVKWARR